MRLKEKCLVLNNSMIISLEVRQEMQKEIDLLKTQLADKDQQYKDQLDQQNVFSSFLLLIYRKRQMLSKKNQFEQKVIFNRFIVNVLLLHLLFLLKSLYLPSFFFHSIDMVTILINIFPFSQYSQFLIISFTTTTSNISL